MSDCIFCKIVSKEIHSEILYEDDELIALSDINPQAPVHILLVSKRHVESLNTLADEDAGLACRMLIVAGDIAKQHKIDESGFRFVINCNKDGGQEVFHLHAHVIGGRQLGKMC